MAQIQIDDKVFQIAQRRATAAGYANVGDYIAEVLAIDAVETDEETPDLDHRFTPKVLAELEQISADAKTGGKTFTTEEVVEHFRRKSDAWRASQPK